MTKAVLESGILQEVNGQYELTGSVSAFAIPATLHDSLMARLDRLVTAKAVAQYAAVLGRQFSYALLHAVSQLDEPTLQRELGRLVDAELLYQRGLPPQATYLFKHALIRDIAYESLLRSTRQGYHQRVATVLEAQFPETAATQPELLAHHCTEAGLNEQAIRYWHQAGQHAIQRSAHAEAIAHLTQGLAVLTTLPHTPERVRQELAFQTSLGQALIAVRGYASEEVEHVYLRARALSQEVDDTAEHVRALMGLYVLFFVRANHEAVAALTGELLQLGQAVQDPSCSYRRICPGKVVSTIHERIRSDYGCSVLDACSACSCFTAWLPTLASRPSRARNVLAFDIIPSTVTVTSGTSTS